ncbi:MULTISPECIES: hypothetical protein [Tenebrionibacter/Tenebrionicola group]|uniref:Uncharacterized protein n=2 Tax=Tenebrionibacter/Tenebrionicola group TaxID=2969848 RepID=A0A8K0XVY4_9ENTR|nr:MULTISPECIES: hypothetical protein [Tenebrionibacter/Tenebrionicola group]MBK4714720.1 hypothetical protein [Tenebrionibacter intestinalis]MBV4413876.1 hypothetical protein [Tenebrionicola larvae]MBV5095192.1 hypothetical protein [Tenebrionicola larvae]
MRPPDGYIDEVEHRKGLTIMLSIMVTGAGLWASNRTAYRPAWRKPPGWP